MTQGNLAQEDALAFILGGNALFTIKSNKTQQRFTFKVLKDSNEDFIYRVSLLTGSDNTRNYRMIGKIDQREAQMIPLSEYTRNFPAFIALDHVYMNLCIGLYMPFLEIWHEGRCCRCGRTLTVPQSIAKGIGPECESYKIVNL